MILYTNMWRSAARLVQLFETDSEKLMFWVQDASLAGGIWFRKLDTH